MMSQGISKKYKLEIEQAAEMLKNIVIETPLSFTKSLSEDFQTNIYLKREDLQIVRSYKLRGAYNMICQLKDSDQKQGMVAASAGNHAQGVAYSCSKQQIKGVIFMPKNTPRQKIKQTRMFGGEYVEIIQAGDTFDDCATEAIRYAEEKGMIFIPPFDNEQVIAGQGTVALEILEEIGNLNIDYIFVPVGGGGLCAGIGAYIKDHSPKTKVIAVEPAGAACLSLAMQEGAPTKIEKIDKFVDGAAVQKIGQLTFPICQEVIEEVCLVPEGEVCTTMLKLYNENAIVVEPAGALSIAALNHYKEQIKGKNVVCIVSGSNNDIDRMQEVKERSLLFEGLKHYFIIRFAQRSNALKDFVNNILGPHDDIVRFEYMKKNQREYGPALVGIELDTPQDYDRLIARMIEGNIDYTVLDYKSDIGRYIV